MSLEDSIRDSIRRIALRWWKLRAIESIGLTLVVGSAVGMLLVPIFAWHSESSWALCVAVLMLSIVVGGIISLRHRPSDIHAAIQADRQWRLDELLVSAAGVLELSGREGIDPAMRETILQLAASELSQHHVNDLVLHRFGRRAWTGMGLLPLLLVLLTGIGSHPLVLRAAAEARLHRENTSTIDKSDRVNSSPADRSIHPAPKPDRARPLNEASDRPTPPLAARAGNESRNTMNATGSAPGRTDDAQVSQARNRSVGSDPADRSGTASGGNGATADSDGAAWQSGRVAARGPAAPPWDRPDWNAQKTRELLSLEQAPASYRDLIRDYFSR